MDQNEKPSERPISNDSTSAPQADLTGRNMDDLLARARQIVKPIIARESASEVVSDDVLNFRMKASAQE